MQDRVPESQLALPETMRLRIIVGVLTCMLLAALDQTIVGPVIPAIGAGLGGSDYISWIVSAYFLTATATTPLYGKIADIYGRRPTLFVALGIFTVGSILCGLAPSMAVLILGRGVQGVGGGGLMALAQTVIADLFPPRERGRVSGYIAVMWGTASVAGPVLGGVIAEHAHWSLIFWLNLPLAVFAFWMTSEPLKRLPWQRREHKLDIAGAALVIVATMAFLMALSLAPQPRFGWTSPTVLALLAVSGVLAVVIVRHLSRSPEPLIPLAVLSNRTVLTATLSIFFAMAAFIGLTVFVPLFLELARGRSAEQAGYTLVLYMIGTVIGANVSGRTMARRANYKQLPLWGLGIGVVGFVWLAMRANTIGLLELQALLLVVGIASGTQFPVTTVSVQNAVDPRDIGVATGVLSFMRSLGSSIGIAVVGAVGAASGISIRMAEVSGAAQGPAVISQISGGAFTPIFIAASVSLALGFVMLMAMPALPLRGREAVRKAEVP